MAKKRSSTKKRRTKRSAKRLNMRAQLLKIISSVSILLFLVLGIALLAHFLIERPSSRTTASLPPEVHKPVPQVKRPVQPQYEIFPKQGLPVKPLAPLKPLPGLQPPKIAIIIDDMGYDHHIAERFLALDAALTFSMLPYGPFSRQIMEDARAKGHEIMLHLPMEPNEYPDIKPGPGALFDHMTPDELIAQLNADIDLFPGLKGVNNHMGSKLTCLSDRMRQIFSILKKRGLYYVDSRTNAETVAKPSAQLLQLPFAERDIFIDHLNDPNFINSQLNKLIQRAQKQGYAIGIAHPHTNTYKALADFLPRLKAEAALVPASLVVQHAMLAQAEASAKAGTMR